MFVHKVAGNWGGKQEWSDDTDPFTVFELYEQGNRYLYQYFCPLLGAETDIFHISQNLPFVHPRLLWVLGQLTGLVFDFGHCRGVCWAWLYLYYLTQFAQLSIVSFFSVPFTATSFDLVLNTFSKLRKIRPTQISPLFVHLTITKTNYPFTPVCGHLT